MSNEVDALLIRSLSELNEAAIRLYVLDNNLRKQVDAEFQFWIRQNGWKGVIEFHGRAERIWITPEEWVAKNSKDTYLYFYLEQTDIVDKEDQWYVASFTGDGHQQIGLWLGSDRVRTTQFNRLWREYSMTTANLPLLGADFFLPLRVDREALATAMLDGDLSDAFESLRETLDRLPELAARLGPLQKAIAATEVS